MNLKTTKATLVLFAMLSLLQNFNAQQCGVINLIAEQRVLDQATNQPLAYDFGQDQNGSQLTLMGRITLNAGTAGVYPLFRVSSLPNAGEINASPSLANLASATYNTEDPNNSFLTFTVADTSSEQEQRDVPVVLPLGEEMGWVLSFDYALGETQFYIQTRNANFKQIFQTQFPEFFLRRRMQLQLGCSPSFQGECGQVTVRQTSFTLDYYPTIEKVLALNANTYGWNDYSYDNYEGGSILFTTTTGAPPTAPSLAGTPFYRPQDGLIAFKGSAALIQDAIDLSNGEGYTWYTVFSYREPLPNNFLFFSTIDEVEHPYEIRLILSADGLRRAQLTFPLQNITLESGDWFTAGAINRLTFVQEQRFGTQQLHLISDGRIVSSEEFQSPVLSPAGRTQFFEVLNETFEGEFRLFDFTEIQNTAGIINNLIKNPAEPLRVACQNNCAFDIDIRNQGQGCAECAAGFVLDQTTQSCINGCPIGFRNIAGRCYQCQSAGCPNLQQNVFSVNNLGSDSFEIVQNIPLTNLQQPLSDNFNVLLSEGELGQDYIWAVQNSANPNRSFYTLQPLNNFQPQQKIAVASLINPGQFVDPNSNVLRNQTFNVDLNGQVTPLIAPPVVLETNAQQPNLTVVPIPQPAPVTTPTVPIVPVVPIAPVASQNLTPAEILAQNQIVPPVVNRNVAAFPVAPVSDPCYHRSGNGRCERVDRTTEERFRAWAIITFIIFLIGMLAGLFGLCFRCPYLRDNNYHDFYYQKFLQAFLMAQFMAFWRLHHVYHPRNLLNFHHHFYQYLIGWHDQLWDKDYPYYNEHKNFYHEGVYNMFPISFGLPQLIILFILVLYVIVKILNMGQQKKLLPERFNTLSPEQKVSVSASARKWACINRFFEWMAVYTVFMIFCIEATVFFLYNFMHYDWDVNDTNFKRFALAWAIIFCIIYVVLLALNWMIALSDRSALYVNQYEETYSTNNYHHDKWWFVQTGLKPTMPHRIFQAFQYFFYMLFAFFLVIAYDKRIVQIIIPFFFFLVLFGFVVALRPAAQSFWQMEQIIAHFLLFIAYLFELILVLDDSPQNLSGTTRWRLGYVVAFFVFMVILWNTLVLIWALLKYFMMCSKAKRGLLPTAYGVGAMRMDPDHETNFHLQKNVNGDYQTVKRRDIRQDRFVPVGDHLISNLSEEKFRNQKKVNNVLQSIPADVEEKRAFVNHGPDYVEEKVVTKTVTNKIVDKPTNFGGKLVQGTKNVTNDVVQGTKNITQKGVNTVKNVIR